MQPLDNAHAERTHSCCPTRNRAATICLCTRQDSSDSRARTHRARASTKRIVFLTVVEVWSVIFSCSWLFYDYYLAVLYKHAVLGRDYALAAKVVDGSLLCVAAIYDIIYTRHLRVVGKRKAKSAAFG